MSLPSTTVATPPELADLDVELKSLLATDPHGWDDATVQQAMVTIVRLGAALDGVASQIAEVWDGRRLWADDGSRSARARLGRDTCENPFSVGDILWRAARLRCMPLVRAAWRDGEIGTDRVDVLCRANTPARSKAFVESEPHLLWMATALEVFDDFVRKVRLWCDLADEAAEDPDPERRARKQRDSRHVSIGRGLDGVRFFQGRLDAVDGEIFDRELKRIEQTLFEADWAQIRAEHGDAATVLHLPRTATQRRADALRIMAERSAACPDGARVPRPLITVVVDHASLMGPVRELFNRTVLTAGQIAGLLTEADIERAVFDGPSRVLDVGVRQRLFSGGTRRAVEIRDRQCTFPGCAVEVERCQVDHIIEWTQGGITTQENGRLLCPAHNRQRPGRRNGSDPPDQVEDPGVPAGPGSGAADGFGAPGLGAAEDVDANPTTRWDGVDRRSGSDRRTGLEELSPSG